MNKTIACLVLTASAAAAGPPARAEASPWSVQVGPAAVRMNVRSSPEAPPGTAVPGAGLDVQDRTTLAASLAYDLAPRWTARLGLGLPMTSDVTGTGSIGLLGRLGRVRHGAGVASLTWRASGAARVSPYLGAGAAYLVIFASQDAAVAEFDASNDWGGVLQAGAELPLGRHLGVFLDVKKIYLSTEIRGSVPAYAGVPTYAKLRVDPLVVQIGASYRF